MDKLVRRVTVVRGRGENCDTKVIYQKKGNLFDDEADHPSFRRLERSVRHVLKAQVIAAQDAYQRHLDSTEKDDASWLYEAPVNLIKAGRKGMKEMAEASPFRTPKVEFADDDYEE